MLPNPPVARSLASNASTTRKAACATGTITSCASRSSGCSVNGSRAAVPAAHHQRALVVGVDQADQVAEHDAVLVAEARARKDHRRVAGVADVDRDAGRHERDVARRERHRPRRRTRAGPCRPIRASRRPAAARARARRARAGRSRGRACVGSAGYEPDFDGRRRAISATSRRASASLSMRGSGCAPASSRSVTALSSAPSASCARLATTSASFLRLRFSSPSRSMSWLSAAKPTQNGALRARGDGREDVHGRLEVDRHRRGRLLDLLRLRARRPVVGDRGDRDEHVLPRDAREHRLGHLRGAGDVDALDADRASPATPARRRASPPRPRPPPRARARSPSCRTRGW